MRMTIAGLAMAAALVFTTATPLMEPSERQFPESLGTNPLPYVKQAISECRPEEEEAESAQCLMLSYLVAEKKGFFDMVTGPKQLLGVEELKKMDNQKPPHCPRWPDFYHKTIAKMFGGDDEKMDFEEFLAFDWTKSESGKIVGRNETTGCPEFLL